MVEDTRAEDARTAAQIEVDVGVEHIADVYAQALLNAAENSRLTDTVLGEFDSLIAEVLDRFPKFEAVLASGLVSAEEKAGILDHTLRGHVSPLLLNSLKVVARHDRLDCLRAIHRRVHALYDRLRGRLPVTIATAAPLDAALVGRITESLRAVLGAEPIVQQVTDADLIGGAVVRVGDTVYDGSIANQLKMARQQMIDRSVHEIQSRRDRFRSAAGNRTV